MEKKYWLHRISHHYEVSYPLLDMGFLSIGFSDFLYNADFLEIMRGHTEGKWEKFEQENRLLWGDKLYRTRYNLWRFLCEFSVGDYVVVPSWGTFSVYKIDGKAEYVGSVVGEGIKDRNGNTVVSGGEGNRYILDEEGKVIDLGFVIPVKKVEINIPRSDYAKNDLLSRLKIRQTNADITDLSALIDSAIVRFQEKKPFNIYSETIKSLSESLKVVIDDIVDHDQFERLIKCYFEKMGADHVYIPSKKDGDGEADGDIVARFDALKLVVYVQAKHHKGTTGETAVLQISEYTDQKHQEECDLDYNSISWVISAAEEFSENAQALAIKKNIRLINGAEFRKMLIDAGMATMESEFSTE